MGAIKGYLTQRPNGLYLVSYMPPAIARVGRTTDLDAFIAVGDGFGQHKVPPSTIQILFGIAPGELSPLSTKRICFSSPGPVECFISRRSQQHGGQCMMTEQEPIKLRGELWPVYGDSIYCNDFCTWFARAVWDFVPDMMESRKVSILGELSETSN